jgi:hypothetical protein
MNDKRYHAWKCEPNCSPIEGTDRVLLSSSFRNAVAYLAAEEGVTVGHKDKCVRLPDGKLWFVSPFAQKV